MKTNAKVVFEVLLMFADGTERVFRTDEWNETILRKRLEKAGKIVIKEERKEVS